MNKRPEPQIRTKPSTDAYRDNYDRIFGKKDKQHPPKNTPAMGIKRK